MQKLVREFRFCHNDPIFLFMADDLQQAILAQEVMNNPRSVYQDFPIGPPV